MSRVNQLFSLVAAASLACTAVHAEPVDYHENWDSYVGPGDTTYNAVWSTVGTRYVLLINDAAFTAPNCLEYPGVNQDRGLMNNLADGITNLMPGAFELAPGTTVSPTADSELDVGMYLRIQAPLSERKKVNAFIVISLGDQNANIPMDANTVLAEPVPALAYGMINGWDEAGEPIQRAAPYFFDGKQWLRTSLGTSTGYNRLWMNIRSNGTAVVEERGESMSAGPYTIYYNGPFDTITIRSHTSIAVSTNHRIDDIYVSGGEGTPGSAMGACCANGQCSFVTAEECANIGGTYAGDNTTCEDPGYVCCASPWADHDGDSDVDADDFGAFQLCLTGIGGGIPSAACSCFNKATGDPEGISEADYMLFEECATGPNIPFVPEDFPAHCQ